LFKFAFPLLQLLAVETMHLNGRGKHRKASPAGPLATDFPLYWNLVEDFALHNALAPRTPFVARRPTGHPPGVHNIYFIMVWMFILVYCCQLEKKKCKSSVTATPA